MADLALSVSLLEHENPVDLTVTASLGDESTRTPPYSYTVVRRAQAPEPASHRSRNTTPFYD
jgi:hypothetical protein